MTNTQPWYFTFGVSSPGRNSYVRIVGTHEGARQEMVRRYDLKWAFQYDEQGFSGQAEQWGLTEIDKTAEPSPEFI